MDKNLEKLKQEVQKVINPMELIVSNIEIREEGKYKFLTIELDKVNGIDLDTIVEATNIINPVVDKYDFIEESYILDIISKERGE